MPVLSGSLAAVVVGALVQSATPSPAPLGTVAFLAMAASLGAASGATFAFVALPARSGPVRSPLWAAPRANWAASCRRW